MNAFLDFLLAYKVDLIILAIILVWGIVKAVQGLLKSLLAVVVLVLAIIIAMVGSNFLAEPVGDFVWQKYGPTIEQRFDDEFGTAIEGGENALNGFKESWSKFLESSGISQINSLISTLAGEGSGSNAEGDSEATDGSESTSSQNALVKNTFSSRIKETVMDNAKLGCYKIVHVVLFIIIAIIAVLVLGLLRDWIQNVTRLPIIGKMDHFLGFLLGIAEAVIVIFFIVRLAGLLGIDTFKDLSQGTILLNWFCGGGLDTEVVNNLFS